MLYDERGKALVNNFRNLQPSNGRIVVETSQKYGLEDEEDEDKSGSSSADASSENLGAAFFKFS